MGAYGVLKCKYNVLSRGYHYVNSDFGNRTYTNSAGQVIKDYHKGIDVQSNTSDKTDYIVCPFPGKVIACRNSYSGQTTDTGTDGMGNYVILDSGNGVRQRFQHMKKGSVTVSVGDNVKAGQKIGYMGLTGNTSGYHLHYDISIGGTAKSNYVDPKPYLTGEKTLPTSSSNSSTSSTPKYYITTGAVNIRKSYSVSADLAKCTYLPEGMVVTVSKTSGSWLKTQFGWIYKTYAKQLSGSKYTITRDVNVRSGTGTNYSLQSFSELPKGIKVKVKSTNGRWANIGIGWVSLGYLTASE